MDDIKTLNVGKSGVTDSFVAEARAMVSKYRKIRVKALKPALDGKRINDVAADVASRTGAKLVDVRGHTFILARK